MSELATDRADATERPAGVVELVAIEGGERHSLDKEQMTIGREPGCDIYISEPNISRQHAVLMVREGSITLEDLDSTNGTFVNKRQIRGRTRLAAGDIVCFDSSNYYLSLPSSETHTVLVRKLRPSVEGTGRSTIAFEPDDDSSDTMVVQEYPLPGSWPIAKDDRVFPDRASKYPAAQVNLVLDAALPNREGVAAAVVVMGTETSGVIRLEIEHEQQRWSIGRSPEQAICLDDVSISSRHATLTHDNGRWGIRDEGSVNSVLVNDRQKGLSSLADGDVISLGRVDLVFRLLN